MGEDETAIVLPVIRCRRCHETIELCGHGWRHVKTGLHSCPIQPERWVAVPPNPILIEP
jgi:hypothetical protein